MKAPGFFEGVLIALFAALAGSFAASLGRLLVGAGLTTDLLLGGLATSYAIYVLWRSPHRTGRLTVLAAWIAMSLGLLAWSPPLLLSTAAYVAALWLIRTAYHHGHLAGAAADLGLQILALAAGIWGYEHSGSLFLGIWSYFLVQALFVAIPKPKPAGGAGQTEGDPPFATAHRSAEAALRRLASIR